MQGKNTEVIVQVFLLNSPAQYGNAHEGFVIFASFCIEIDAVFFVPFLVGNGSKKGRVVQWSSIRYKYGM